MTVKMKIKKGDSVVVITGRDKGKTGTIMSVSRKDLKVIVSGLNMVKRHTKPTANSAGGIIAKEAAIHVSNVAYFDKALGAGTKLGYKIADDGKKSRIAKKSGEIIDN
jgi:large subunit ribosomal protein L24